MDNLASWSPAAASFLQGVAYCLIMFATGGITVITLLETESVFTTIIVFAVALVGGIALTAVIPSPEISAEHDEETDRTAGALGFAAAFFLLPVALLVSVWLLLGYFSRR